ncbi:MAG: endoglucanase [Lachnospiraceae bacterium]
MNENTIKNIPYKYGNMPIPGGGYVTGFSFHPKVPGILYCRTDIGGCYRYDFENDNWISLVEHVTHFDRSETFPLAIALDNNSPETLYVVSGIGRETLGKFPNGYFSVSHDYGKTFTVSELPCHVHGNNPGRGTGYRLIVDPADSGVIYFASQEAGLLCSRNQGQSWETIPVFADSTKNPEKHLSFVWKAPEHDTLVVASSGTSNKINDTTRGHSLFVSYDGGKTFTELEQPEPGEKNNAKWVGYVGHRYDFDGKYLYITMNQTGPYAYMVEQGYSSDCGNVTEGRIIRFAYNEDGTLGEMEDITPSVPEHGINPEFVPFGFGGICSTPQIPGYLLTSTICHPSTDMVLVSHDYGITWKVILKGLEIGNMHFNAPYMKPEYNGGASLIHWLTDIKINPFDANMAFFNTGTGVFGSTNLQSDNLSWCDHCNGIEETVHLNVYAPIKGSIVALDIVGDLGGFVFTDTDTPCENSFADEKGDRYITSINADYPDEIPDVFVATPRGNWTGKTCGGVVYSNDAGKTLKHCGMPYGLSEKLDKLLDAISRPNNNSGWIAISPDGEKLVWSVADGILLPSDCVVYSDDKGESWKHAKVYDLNGNPASGCLKPFYDRVNNHIVYGFGEKARLYVSTDSGATFHEKQRPDNMPVQDLSGIDAQCIVEIRGIAGKSGEFMFAMNVDGLWKISYCSKCDKFFAEKLSSGDDAVYCVGLGILPDTEEYINNDKALYVCAVIKKIFGFYRSFDYGKTWEKINNENQMFGEIKSIDADKKVFGRYFIATGTRGLKYGIEK